MVHKGHRSAPTGAVAPKNSRVAKSGKINVSSPTRAFIKSANLLRQYAAKTDAKSSLLEEQSSRYFLLQLNFSRSVGQSDTFPTMIPLPHGLHSHTQSEICLVVRDPQRQWKDKLAEEKPDQRLIAKVIDFKHLRANYSTPQLKRKLLGEYSLFLADEKLVHLLPGQLGSAFVRAKKCPRAVKLRATKPILPLVEEQLAFTELLRRPGPSMTVKVGHLDLTDAQVGENAMATLEAVRKLAADWNDGLAEGEAPWELQAAHLQLMGSVSIPVDLTIMK